MADALVRDGREWDCEAQVQITMTMRSIQGPTHGRTVSVDLQDRGVYTPQGLLAATERLTLAALSRILPADYENEGHER